MEKKLVLISNALEHFEDNTLINFKNYIPSNFLSPHLTWSVCVESISFHAIFKNRGLPKDDHFPSFLQIKREELPYDIDNMSKTILNLDIFQAHHKIYIESSDSYTAKQLDVFIKFKLMTHYKINPRTYGGFPTKFENDVIKYDIRL